jgi:dipeptidyl aminopeptidase/acylaminoacyl peptidase
VDRLVRPVDELMQRSVFFCAAAATLAFATSAATAHAKPVLTLQDLRKSVSLSSPRISPDGSRIAVLVARRDYVKDLINTDLVLVDVRTHAARELVRRTRFSGVAWSPDGRSIAYIAVTGPTEDRESQLFVLPMDGGEPLALTHAKEGVEAFTWRPDGRAIAYVAGGEAPNAKSIEQKDDAFDVTDEAWTAQAAPVNDVLYEIPARGGTAHRIAHWSQNIAGGLTYAADGGSLFVTRSKPDTHPNRYLSREIVRVRVRDGAVTPIGALSATQSDPVRSRDGRYIAYSFANPKGTMQSEVALADANGRNPRFLTASLDRNVQIEDFDPDDALVLGANDGGRHRFYRVSAGGIVSSYPLERLPGASEASISKHGTIALTAAAADHPVELYVLLPHANAPVRLTHYNDWIDGFALGRASVVTWRTSDGLVADGIVITPPNDKGGHTPLVLYIHGGPTAASTIALSGFPQVLAAHGWTVFMPNYRGSDNLGLEFARSTVPHIASVPGSDIERGITEVLRLGFGDSSRLGVSGWSEGGLMTSWLIGHDTRFRAAVSGAAVNDWIGYSAMTDAKDFTPQFIGPSPWTTPALIETFDAESPLTYAQNVKTPTLIMSDAGDYRVPTPLAYEFYHDVRATGTPVQFVIYPVNGHFPADPVRAEDVNRRWEAWLLKYL